MAGPAHSNGSSPAVGGTASEENISTTPKLPPRKAVVPKPGVGITTFRDALNELDDKRIADIKPLIPPQILMEDVPMTESAAITVARARVEASSVIKGDDDRLLVVVGPCSIHDVKAALEYGKRLREYMETAGEDLVIIMRVYFEKPRTTVGWKGLINDPFLDGTYTINKGLRIARNLLLELNEMGIPTGCEFLDTISPQYIGDLVAWGAIGARTTESQVHRELASGLSVPVGFKNGTDGNTGVAIDAIRAASVGHHFLSVTKQGLSAIVETTGNDSCHVILRGGVAGPNYGAEFVAKASEDLKKQRLRPRIMVDCSHGNSSKQHSRQIIVAEDLANQMEGDNVEHAEYVAGVMIESHINEGRQNIPDEGPEALKYGVSITDACISWDQTVKVLDRLRLAVRNRRKNKGKRMK
ncbi:3-deoxy-7-phosphoheptulonate synthase [Cladochytrium replicatum]|nr:3-deoxy-7-phosphoheptulonate synthase [Cladochytrium replicatum]